jgi:acylphosphatase
MSNLVPYRLLTTILLLVNPLVGLADEAKGSDTEKVARHVYYSGQVQGVGFRATAAEIAQGYQVTGWVKNLDDKRVELLVEGPEQDVLKFLEAVHNRWKDNIDKEEVEKKKPTGEFKGFSVRR